MIARAGLYLDVDVLSENLAATVALGSLPVLFEAGWLALIFYYFFQFPIAWAFTLGFGVSCMSPGVVVPLIMNLLDNGWKKSWIPPIALAGLSVDVLIATVGFGISISTCFGHGHENTGAHNSWIFRGAEEVTGGILFGALIGFISYVLQRIFNENIVSGIAFCCSSIIMNITKATGLTGAGITSTFLSWMIIGNTFKKSNIDQSELKLILKHF